MKNQSELLDFFKQIQKIIAKHGFEKFLSEIKKIQIDLENIIEQKIIDYILLITAKHYKIEVNDILNSKKRGIIAESRRMAFGLMKEHLSFTDEEIGYCFNGRSRQYVNKELSDLHINEEHIWKKRDVQFLNDFMFLTKNVLDYINENNLIKEKYNIMLDDKFKEK